MRPEEGVEALAEGRGERIEGALVLFSEEASCPWSPPHVELFPIFHPWRAVEVAIVLY